MCPEIGSHPRITPSPICVTLGQGSGCLHGLYVLWEKTGQPEESIFYPSSHALLSSPAPEGAHLPPGDRAWSSRGAWSAAGWAFPAMVSDALQQRVPWAPQVGSGWEITVPDNSHSPGGTFCGTGRIRGPNVWLHVYFVTWICQQAPTHVRVLREVEV